MPHDGAGGELRIEPFGEGDLEAARAVYNHYVAHSTATFAERPLDAAGAREMFLFADPRHAAFALRHAGGFVGYSLLGPYKARCANRDAAEVAFYLAPGRTGRGWGAAGIKYNPARASSAARVWRGRV